MSPRETPSPGSAAMPPRIVSAEYPVLDASPNAVVAIDRQGAITYVNPRALATFGYRRDELIGRPVEVLVPDHLVGHHVELREGLGAHPVARPMGIGLDLAARRKDGTVFPVEISLAPVETIDGNRVFATIIDITARKVAEAALLHAQKLESIGRLTGAIAHDFNNMLFAIRGYATLLSQDLGTAGEGGRDREESRHNVLAIAEAADRASRLTARLLAFSRQQAIAPSVLDVNVAVRGLESMVQGLIGQNVRLVLKLDRDAGRIFADPGQLDQILVNLVVNARDAMPQGGSVTIETGNVEFDEPYAIEEFDVTPGSYVLLAVGDTGVGMDRETRKHIFEPFFTTKEVGQGTGLGLATIYGIVRQAGGHIWLYSEPGQGSTFKLYFPRVDAPAEEVRGPAKATQARGSGTVLVVDDETLVREMTIQVLTRAGYQVIGVADGADAMTRLADRDEPIDVLVTDVIMPNMLGTELVDWVMDRFPGVGVVVLSGYTPDPLNLERAMARGAKFAPKPLNVTDLLVAIHEAQEERRLQPESRDAAALDPSPNQATPDQAAGSVLVVDDDPSVRAMIARGLRRSGFEVLEADGGETALRLVETAAVGIVVMDMGMPGLSGTDVVRALRDSPRTATLPVILMTGSGDQFSVIGGLAAGANDFLAKPVRLDELVARVRAHLRTRAMWSTAIEVELRDRSAIVASLGHMTISPVPEEAAQTVVSELARRSAFDFIAVLQLGRGDRMRELATYSRVGGVRRGGSLLGPHVSRDLVGRARLGAWVEDIRELTDDVRSSAFSSADLANGAGAPIYGGNELVGLLSLGYSRDSGRTSPTRTAGLLAAAIDYASLLSAIAGPGLADRRGLAATRAHLRRVLTAQEFHPVFQPIVQLGSGAIVGYEALTRFTDGKPPDARFVEAASVGLGYEFELAAIHAALRVARSLPEEGFLSLNVSPGLVLERGRRLRSTIASTTRPLVLELTEHVAIGDYPALRAAIATLGDVRIAVDDAGAGYASLRHILELRPAFAKLDISLVRGIEGDGLRQAMAAGLGYFALRSGCHLIAEGVETDSEANALRKLGIEYAQGYMFGRPEPVAS